MFDAVGTWLESPILTSELWGEQEGLQQGVQVAGAPLILDTAEIALSPARRWLFSPFCTSSSGRTGRKASLLIFFEKIPKHTCLPQ